MQSIIVGAIPSLQVFLLFLTLDNDTQLEESPEKLNKNHADVTYCTLLGLQSQLILRIDIITPLVSADCITDHTTRTTSMRQLTDNSKSNKKMSFTFATITTH